MNQKISFAIRLDPWRCCYQCEIIDFSQGKHEGEFLYKKVLSFWFEEIDSDMHYKKDAEFDELLRQKFGKLHESAAAGELFSWRRNSEGALAEIIILDQFSRNMFRGKPQAFGQDALALACAQFAIDKGFDLETDIKRRSGFYMPFMHSESKVIHEQALKLFNQPGLEGSLKYEIMHKNIIDRFHRYPHRNAVMGRVSTKEEVEFLQQDNSSF